MARIFIYDTETNSLDTQFGFIQELAWAVYDSDSWRCITARSELLSWPTSYEVNPEALAVTGLSREFCRENGSEPSSVFERFILDSSSCEYLCGHNAIGFDLPMVMTNIKRCLLFDWDHGPSANHIDTLTDLEFPKTMKVQALKYLALDHGYILSGAHEALADVFACAAILKKYPFERTVEIAKTPMRTIKARINWDDLETKERIKNSRFYWNAKEKLWEKRVREFFIPGIQIQLGTDVELLFV